MTRENTAYLLARHEQATAAARAAENKAARIAHLELAYRYSLMLAQTAGAGATADHSEGASESVYS